MRLRRTSHADLHETAGVAASRTIRQRRAIRRCRLRLTDHGNALRAHHY
jgi:hypothetical protein